MFLLDAPDGRVAFGMTELQRRYTTHALSCLHNRRGCHREVIHTSPQSSLLTTNFRARLGDLQVTMGDIGFRTR